VKDGGRGKREEGRVKREQRRVGRALRTSGCAACPLPSSLFPLPLFLVALSCTSLTTRPNIRPFPLAAFDSLAADPAGVAEAARAGVMNLGMKVAAYSGPEGYLETRWFDLQTRRSHRYNTNPGRFVRLRVWTDLIAPRATQVVVETVYRETIDPSIPDREAERVAGPDTPADSITQAVRKAIREKYTPAALPAATPDSAKSQ
jgi:hypothetical protein